MPKFHVDDDRSLGRLYFPQRSAEAALDARYDELKAMNATPNQMGNDLELGRMKLEYSALFGASPDQIAEGREIRAERATIPFLREKWNSIPGETQSAIKKYETRYGK